MRTDTRKEAEARLHQVGPFIIRRGDRREVPTYATKSGGWATDRSKAWRFDTEKQAQFCLRGRVGEIVPADAEVADQVTPRSVSLAPALAASVGPLTSSERKTLEDCEARIQKGLQSFLDVAAALLTVRAGLLYRQGYGTFEEYCRQRWGITPRRARQMCDGANVVANLSEGNGGAGPLPTNERQTRALQGLPKPQQQLVWREAVAAAPNGKAPTGKQVAEVAARSAPAQQRVPLRLAFAAAAKARESEASAPDYSGATVTRKGVAQAWDELPMAAKTVHLVDSPAGPSIREAMAYLGAVDDELGQAKDAAMQSNVHRALVLLRPVLQKYAGCDNMRAERLDKGQKPDPIVEARFHTIDAAVEARAALQLLESQTGMGLTQEMYQAEKAVDHLNCLKVLLTNYGMRKPKGKR